MTDFIGDGSNDLPIGSSTESDGKEAIGLRLHSISMAYLTADSVATPDNIQRNSIDLPWTYNLETSDVMIKNYGGDMDLGNYSYAMFNGDLERLLSKSPDKQYAGLRRIQLNFDFSNGKIIPYNLNILHGAQIDGALLGEQITQLTIGSERSSDIGMYKFNNNGEPLDMKNTSYYLCMNPIPNDPDSTEGLGTKVTRVSKLGMSLGPSLKNINKYYLQIDPEFAKLRIFGDGKIAPIIVTVLKTAMIPFNAARLVSMSKEEQINFKNRQIIEELNIKPVASMAEYINSDLKKFISNHNLFR